ncbi:hypothetical protein ACFQ1S_39085, partial [Kibdelosporangium lantanae]
MVSIVLHYLVAYVMAMRLALTTYKLPRPSQVPITRPKSTLDNLILIVVLVAVSLFVAAGAACLVSRTGGDMVYYTFILLAIPTAVNASAGEDRGADSTGIRGSRPGQSSGLLTSSKRPGGHFDNHRGEAGGPGGEVLPPPRRRAARSNNNSNTRSSLTRLGRPLKLLGPRSWCDWRCDTPGDREVHRRPARSGHGPGGRAHP